MQRQPAILLAVVVAFASAMVLRLVWLQLLLGGRQPCPRR